MKAIRQSEFGPAESLRYEDVPDPEPAEGQVLLAVEAAGVHLIDTKALDRATELLGRGGRIVSYGWASEQPSALDEDALRERGIEQPWGVGPRAAPMGDFRELETRSLAATRNAVWVPLLNPPYKLAEAAAAHTAIETRGTMGKVVLVP